MLNAQRRIKAPCALCQSVERGRLRYAPDSQRRRIDSGAVSQGISTGDFTEALEGIAGEKASGLSATNIVRLKAS
jgi:hypothetical protein